MSISRKAARIGTASFASINRGTAQFRRNTTYTMPD